MRGYRFPSLPFNIHAHATRLTRAFASFCGLRRVNAAFTFDIFRL